MNKINKYCTLVGGTVTSQQEVRVRFQGRPVGLLCGGSMLSPCQHKSHNSLNSFCNSISCRPDVLPTTNLPIRLCFGPALWSVMQWLGIHATIHCF